MTEQVAYGQAEPEAGVDEPLAALHAALVAAQAAFPPIQRNRTVEVPTKSGGKFSYSYTTLDEILEKTRKPLTDNGLALLQWMTGEGLQTELRHIGGGVLSRTFPWPSMPANPQDLGKLVTYLRRYEVSCALGLASEEDTDGSAPQRSATPGGAEPSPLEIRRETHAQIAILVKELNEKAPPAEGQKSWEQEVRDLIGKKSRAQFTEEEGQRAITYLQEQLDAAEIPFG